MGSQKTSNCSNSLNFEAKINFNTTRQNDLKWRKTCIGVKFDLMHFNGPQTKFIRDSLYKHPVVPANCGHGAGTTPATTGPWATTSASVSTHQVPGNKSTLLVTFLISSSRGVDILIPHIHEEL